jgi:hypothetical protein
MRSEAKRGTRLELVGIPQNISSHFPWGKNGVCAFFFFFASMAFHQMLLFSEGTIPEPFSNRQQESRSQ